MKTNFRIRLLSFVRFLPILLLVSGMLSCTNNEQIQFIDIEEESWRATDTISFNVSEKFVNKPLELKVRTTSNYPFQNIWIEVLIDSTQTVRKEIQLADNAGHWLGKKSGKFHLTSVPIEVFIPNDSTKLKVVHLMRVEKLNGIQAVGVEVLE